MKNSNIVKTFLLLIISTMLSSCEAIAGIFKAGMGFGIFLVIAVIALIIFIIAKATGKNNNP